MKIPRAGSITDPQLRYVQILSDDLGFDRRRRNAHLKEIIGRDVSAPDELTLDEASRVITTFKEWKENAKPNHKNSEDD